MKTFVKVLSVIMGIFMIVCGIYCICQPSTTALMMGYVVGLSMIFDAVAGFAFWAQEKKAGRPDGWLLTSAVISAVLGFFLVNSSALQLAVDAFIIYYIAAWLLCQGILAVVRALKIRRLHKNLNTVKLGAHWYVLLCLGIVVCAFGILCFFKPIIIASTIGVFIGIGVISAGADIITIATIKEV